MTQLSIIIPVFNEAESLDETARGVGGFGSTTAELASPQRKRPLGAA